MNKQEKYNHLMVKQTELVLQHLKQMLEMAETEGIAQDGINVINARKKITSLYQYFLERACEVN